MSAQTTAIRRLAVLGLAVACALLSVGPVAAGPSPVVRARWLMGTMFTASAPAADSKEAVRVGDALDRALDEVASLDRALSNWSETSELSRLNALGRAEAPSPALAAVLDSALTFAAMTGGAFDPTIEPLVRAWDLRGKGRVPDARTLAAARARVGHDRVTRTGDRIELGDAQLDLSGIAKGFALDRAGAVLAASGVREAVLDGGGQRLGAPGASVWVADPRDRDRAAVRVRLGTGSLATSVQRERSLIVRGRRVGHVLDPRTGEPVPFEASVSVAAANGTRADALSTALLVMGRAAAQAFAASHPDLGVLWLEPTPQGLDAYAWNLEVDSAASHVRIMTLPALRSASR